MGVPHSSQHIADSEYYISSLITGYSAEQFDLLSDPSLGALVRPLSRIRASEHLHE